MIRKNMILAAALMGLALNADANPDGAVGEQAARTSTIFEGAKMEKGNQSDSAVATGTASAKTGPAVQSEKSSLFGRLRSRLSGADVKPKANSPKMRRENDRRGNRTEIKGVVPVLLAVMGIVGASIGLAFAASKIAPKQNWNQTTTCTDPVYGEDFNERWLDNDGDRYDDEYWGWARNFYYRDCTTRYSKP